jgi:hypothetical protein
MAELIASKGPLPVWEMVWINRASRIVGVMLDQAVMA